MGIGVSIYFKLLKKLATFFTIVSVLAIVPFFCYGTGNVSKQASGYIKTYLGQWTLGNIG
jgi:hypothetical protein